MIPKIGDQFFSDFESEYKNYAQLKKHGNRYILNEIGHVIEDRFGRKGWYVRGENDFEDLGFDCFWSEKLKTFVYSLEDVKRKK